MQQGLDPPLTDYPVMLTGQGLNVGLRGVPIPLPKENFGSPGDSDEETDDDTAAAIPSACDPEDGDP